MDQVIAKDLLINYLVFNKSQEASQSLLFLHGWRSNKEIWQNLIGKLISRSADQLTSYSIDLPGFGSSQKPTGPMTVGDYSEVVEEFIRKLDLKNVIIVGHSFGGRVGIKLASKNPQIISKLVLVDSAGFTTNTNKKSFMAAVAKIAKPFFKPGFMQPLRNKIYKHMGAEDYVATPELQKTFVNIVGEDLTEDMKKINCPTFIITGENDQDTPVEFGEKMHSLIQNSKFKILNNAGHFSFLDRPEEFVKELNEFIK